ncbi:MAG: hypothetical protein RIT81_39020 [Deltaproteobacteria bacterium]
MDLDREPLAISVVEHDDTGRVSFSDVPDRLIPALVEAFGEERVARAIHPSDPERAFWMSLPVMPKRTPWPRFKKLFKNGELEKRVRSIGEVRPAPYFMTAINLSDEPVLGKTGVVYFVCKKGCHFCQYRDFEEHTVDPEGLARRMLALQAGGADNVQFLSPTAYTKAIVVAIYLAAQRGFSLPIVHKSEGEDSPEDLALLDGLVDVYVPDAKFMSPDWSARIGLPAAYPARMQACIQEMYRQVGPLTRRAEDSILHGSGVLVRHLLMPHGVPEMREVLTFVKSIDERLPAHIMTGYEPLHDAANVEGIDRPVTPGEIHAATQAARKVNLEFSIVR